MANHKVLFHDASGALFFACDGYGADPAAAITDVLRREKGFRSVIRAVRVFLGGVCVFESTGAELTRAVWQ